MAVALLAALFSLAAPAGPASASPDDGGFASRMLSLVNQQRASAGVAPVQWSAGIAGIAADSPYTGCGFSVAGRATDMGTRNYFSHTVLGCGTQSVFNMLTAAGIQSSGSGENIAWMNGTTDPLLAADRLMNDLMASPGHKANILDPGYNTIGIGSWHTSAGQSWTGGGGALGNVFIAVQVFAHTATTATTTPPTTTPPTTTPPTTAPPTTTPPTTTPPTTTPTTKPPTTTTTPTTAPPAPPALPGAPTNVVAGEGNGSAAVSWGPAVGGPAVDMYAVLAWDATGYSNHSATACATCMAASVPGLTNGHRYYFTVYGHDGAGWGAPGSSGWVMVGAVPGSPTGVTIAPGNASLTTTWGAPATAATAIDGYAVLAYDANGYTSQYAWVCATCMTANVAGLINGHSYYALVYAHNVNGWSAPVTTGSIVAGTPGSPGSVSVSPSARAVNATWAPAASTGSPIDMYAVLAFDSTGYTGLSSTACATCTAGGVTGLTSGRTYTISVYAHNAQGWGVPTTSAPVTAA